MANLYHGGEGPAARAWRVAQDHAATVHMELLRRFRDDTTPAAVDRPRRTVATLLDGAARIRAEQQRREAVRRAEEQARREESRALAHERRLDELADLQALAERDDRPHELTRRRTALRQEHAQTTLIGRLDRANL